MRRQALLALISSVAESLDTELDKFILVGGAAAALLIDSNAAIDIRPTDDIDLVLDVESYLKYNQLIELLRKKHGFKHDMNGPLCRFIVRGVTVDLMPTDEEVLRFTNKWYKHALKSFLPYQLSNGLTIKVVSPAIFLCTKLEAFKDRGRNDFYGSHDLEDIITVIISRSEILTECSLADHEIKDFLSHSFKQLMQQQNFLDVLEDLLPFALKEKTSILKERLNTLARLA